jgi:hypothetical protein
MSIHYQKTLNYFDNRSTNASSDTSPAKIKAFRAQFRGVRNVELFLFMLNNQILQLLVLTRIDPIWLDLDPFKPKFKYKKKL